MGERPSRDRLEQFLAAQREVLGLGGVRHVHAAGAEAAAQLREPLAPVRAREVHFVYEDENRHLIALQQPPERLRVALHAVRAADDQDGVVEHLQRALGLGGEVHVPRRVEQRQLRLRQGEQRLL